MSRSEETPTVRAVNLLIYATVKSGADSAITLDTRDTKEELVAKQGQLAGLPMQLADELDAITDDSVTIATMINRLKVMAGLNPLPYPEPTDGRIELRVAHEQVVLRLRVHDSDGEQRAEIHVAS